MPATKPPQILFICPSKSTFIDVDRRILESAFAVETIFLAQSGSRIGYLWNIARMKARVLFSPARLVIVWFADYHAAVAVLAARITRKQSIVMVGGYDAVCYPKLGMGVYTSPLRSFFAKLALRFSTRIITNHEALVSSQNRYYNPNGHPEGVLNLVPNLRTPVDVAYNATPALAPSDLSGDRENVFLCVGTTPRFNDIYNKGWDLVIQVAIKRPDLHFIIVGLDPAWLPDLENLFHLAKIPNLKILPPQPHSRVLEMMRNCRFFVQPSISEGMPNSLMEAMLMGCVPVGSRVAGIPLIIGDNGVVFDNREPACLESALDQAIQLESDPVAISQSVASRFSFENRRAAILAIIEKMKPDSG